MGFSTHAQEPGNEATLSVVICIPEGCTMIQLGNVSHMCLGVN